jgi:hypothetical protein
MVKLIQLFSCIINGRLKIVYKTMTFQIKIREQIRDCFGVSPNMTLKVRTIAMFKCFVKQNNDLDKTCRYAHDIYLFQT